MPTYQYLAYDNDGNRLRSSDTAGSERELRKELTRQGIYVSSLKEVTDTKSRRSLFPQRVSQADLGILLRQLAILLNAGIALDEAFRLISEQSENNRLKSVVESWRQEVLSGYSFSMAMERSPFVANPKVVAAVGVAEQTGHLHTVLERVADDMEIANDNHQTLVKGLIYPSVMVFVAIVVIGVMVGYVVPQVAKVFVNARQELPLLTRTTIALSNFLRDWGLYLIMTVTASLAAFWWLLRDPDRRERWQRFLLTVPVFGHWVLIGTLADWCRSMGTMLISGVPAMSAMAIASAATGNLHIKRKMESVTERVRQGNSLSQALKSERFVPGFMLHMIGSGENSGEMGNMLLKISDYYSKRLRNAVETILKLLEPALIVIMGIVVLLIVGAVLVPIVEMNQLI